MSEFILILLWIGLCAFFARQLKVTKTELVCGVEEERYYWLFAFIVFLPIIIMAGLRGDFADTFGYKISFNNLPSDFSEFGRYLETVKKDKGFSILAFIIKSVVGNNAVFYFVIIAFIQGLILLSVYRKYSTDYILSVFLFIVSTDYVAWMFNGIRQFVAVTIVFAAIKLMLSKKYIPLLIIILFASTMHQSALLMIPIVIIVQGKAWNKKTLIFIFIVLLSILFLDLFTNMLDDTLQNTQYVNVVRDYKSWKDDGTNPLRVLLYSIPTIIAFFGRKKIAESDSKLINLCVNMSIVSTGLYVISIFTSGIFIGRLPIYASLFNYILLPWEIKHIVHKKYQVLFSFLLIIVYLVFYYYQMHLKWALF